VVCVDDGRDIAVVGGRLVCCELMLRALLDEVEKVAVRPRWMHGDLLALEKVVEPPLSELRGAVGRHGDGGRRSSELSCYCAADNGSGCCGVAGVRCCAVNEADKLRGLY
jgi:hypothetical protein